MSWQIFGIVFIASNLVFGAVVLIMVFWGKVR